jgi:hypothetical protein
MPCVQGIVIIKDFSQLPVAECGRMRYPECNSGNRMATENGAVKKDLHPLLGPSSIFPPHL